MTSALRTRNRIHGPPAVLKAFAGCDMWLLRMIVLLPRALRCYGARFAAKHLSLRHRLAVLEQNSERPRLQKRDRISWVSFSKSWTGGCTRSTTPAASMGFMVETRAPAPTRQRKPGPARPSWSGLARVSCSLFLSFVCGSAHCTASRAYSSSASPSAGSSPGRPPSQVSSISATMGSSTSTKPTAKGTLLKKPLKLCVVVSAEPR
jgi:hypothetical protein